VAPFPVAHGGGVPNQKPLPLEDKLDALRQADHVHAWQSLDERVCCILCERTFSGRQVEVTIGSTGRIRIKCPTDGCSGTPTVWVSPGNPLVSEKVWRDWQRVLSGRKANRRSSATRATSTTSKLATA
jgi:hypothetical protein